MEARLGGKIFMSRKATGTVMTIFSFLTLFGGLAIFLYGMNVMGDSLEKSSAGKLKAILENLTSNPIKGVLLGAGVTAIIQSSSATTVMVVGFVNSGIMKLSQSIGIIMGANIGTTITSWILSLTGIKSDNPIVKLFTPLNLSLIMAVIGIIPVMFSKSSRKKDLGTICLGFAVLMMGMNMMSSAVSPLADMPEFQNILLIFSNPVLGVLVGALMTAIIQSSSASVGILQAISTTGSITYASAIPIILGQNIGTCITAILSSIGTNKNAKRSAVVHLSFNIIGTLAFLAIYYPLDMLIKFSFTGDVISPIGIAVVHSTFNIFSTLIMLPFAKLLEKLAYIIIKDKDAPEKIHILDERLLATPPIALAECKKLTDQMAELSKNTLIDSLGLLTNYSAKKAEEIRENENKIDHYEDKLGSYLVKLSQRSLSVSDSHEVANLLHSIGDFERIADHAVNLTSTAEEINTKKIKFSDSAHKELGVVISAVKEILENTTAAFINEDLELAKGIEPLEQVIDRIKRILKNRHIDRLQKGECTIELGFVFSDILTNIERVSDHCSNIAVCMIQVADDSFRTHEYLNNVKYNDGNHFNEEYQKYKKKYYI